MTISRLRGRPKIFVNTRDITGDNIVEVLQATKSMHDRTIAEINRLYDFRGGDQPLLGREKKIRKEIDIHDVDNVADYIAWFHTAYFWSNPPMLIQRGDIEEHKTDASKDDMGISSLNEMLMNGEAYQRKNAELGDSVETCGIGHRMVDIRTDFEDGLRNRNGKVVNSLVHLYNLDSRNAYCAYYVGPGKEKVLGVSFVTDNEGKRQYTCFTKTERYEIRGVEEGDPIIEKHPNPLNMIPIFEYERAVDRTGSFEKQMDGLNAQNVINSDFDNDIAQNVQPILWANDINLPNDENGNTQKPKGGDMIESHSGMEGNPRLEYLDMKIDRASTLNLMMAKRATLLKNARVPIQYDSEGGGSTGVAMGYSTGWVATGIDANLEEAMVRDTYLEEIKCIIRAIQFVPERVLPIDDPIRKIHASDIDLHFTRERNYDLAVKMNALATGMNVGVHPRHMLKVIDAFPDTQQVYVDSMEMMRSYQEMKCKTDSESERILSDESDQTTNSPYIGGRGFFQESTEESTAAK